MYPCFSLYPGDAFVMCESIGEFDQNVPLPSAAVKRVDTGETVQPADVQSPLTHNTERVVRFDPSFDPVLMTIGKLQPLYDEKIKPLLNQDYSLSELSMAERIERFENVSSIVSCAVNLIRCILVKQVALLNYYTGPQSPVNESFMTHLGTFIKNADYISQQGYDSYECSYHALPLFTNDWSMKGFVTLIANQPDALNAPIFMKNLRSVLSDFDGSAQSIVNTFDSLVDMIGCIFGDPARMSRLEATNRETVSFRGLLSEARYTIPDATPTTVGECCTVDMYRVYMCLASKILKDISSCCYEAVCELSSGEEVDLEQYSECLHDNMMKCVNLFALGTAVSMTYATRLRYFVAREKTVKEYTEFLLNLLKAV